MNENDDKSLFILLRQHLELKLKVYKEEDDKKIREKRKIKERKSKSNIIL